MDTLSPDLEKLITNLIKVSVCLLLGFETSDNQVYLELTTKAKLKLALKENNIGWIHEIVHNGQDDNYIIDRFLMKNKSIQSKAYDILRSVAFKSKYQKQTDPRFTCKACTYSTEDVFCKCRSEGGLRCAAVEGHNIDGEVINCSCYHESHRCSVCNLLTPCSLFAFENSCDCATRCAVECECECHDKYLCECDCHLHPHPEKLKEFGIRTSMPAVQALDIFEIEEVEANITVFSKLSDYMYELYCCVCDFDDNKQRYLKLYDVVLDHYIKKYNLKDFNRDDYKQFRYNETFGVSKYPTKDSVLEFSN